MTGDEPPETSWNILFKRANMPLSVTFTDVAVVVVLVLTVFVPSLIVMLSPADPDRWSALA